VADPFPEAFDPEALSAVFAAIAMKVNRAKDKAKAELLLTQSDLNESKLNEILSRHGIKRTI